MRVCVRVCVRCIANNTSSSCSGWVGRARMLGVDLDWYMNIGVFAFNILYVIYICALFYVTFTLSNGIESGP